MEISPRQVHVAFVAIMRPPRPSLKLKHEIYHDIESFCSRGAGKLKWCLFQICYNNTENKHTVQKKCITDPRVRYIGRSINATKYKWSDVCRYFAQAFQLGIPHNIANMTIGHFT